MNRLPLLGRFLASLLLVHLLVSSARGQSFDQRQLLYSTNSSPVRGVNWAPQPPAALPNVPGAHPNQFRGGIVYGGVTKQSATPALVAGNFAANADAIGWPRSRSGSTVVSILRATVGGPYLSHGFDFLFGQTITPPLTDLGGTKLSPEQTNYWHPEPVFIKTVLTTNSLSPLVIVTNLVLDSSIDHAGADYYWSPHRQVAYATKAGQVRMIWRLASSSLTTLPPGGQSLVSHVQVGPYFYPITNTTVLVAGIPFQTARKIYWTKGDFEKTGKPVLVPTGVKSINFLYNASIPASVPENQVVIGGRIQGSSGGSSFDNGNLKLYTDTIRVENGFITAYNREGRIFMELLGDSTGENTKRQLGVEIVDVQRDAIPNDVVIELGERVTAYPDNQPSDSDLEPSPINQIGQSFAYRRSVSATGGIELYATRVTEQVTDYQVHWMEEGVGGLRWPYRFVRYTFVWPSDVSKYSHYVRPVVENESAARLTSIALPGENAPRLEFQDPSNNNTPRAKVTEDSRFFTFLDETQPALRALVRYNVGDRVAFERIFSWLDKNLKSPQLLSDTVATNLVAWNSVSPGVDFRNLPAFAARLTTASDAFSFFLKSKLSPSTQAALAAYNSFKSSANADALDAGLVSDLNSILTSGARDELPGLTWELRETSRDWTSIAMSSDGRRMIAAVNGGQLHTSTNHGATWTARETVRNWQAVASSADGTKLVAAASGSQVFVSNDSGLNWTACPVPVGFWSTVACSADGQRIFAASTESQIYVSTDGGANWAPRETARSWRSIACSADGLKVVAADSIGSGQIHTSTDGGQTWTPRHFNASWRAVASSANGSILLAGVDGGFLYASTDSGVTWTLQVADVRSWRSLALSGDGTKRLAVANNGVLLVSPDSGASWTVRQPSGPWTGAASSADGSTLAAVATSSQIRTSIGFYSTFATQSGRPVGSSYAERRSNFEAAFAEETFAGQQVVGSDALTSPRVFTKVAYVGDRIAAPAGDLGGNGTDYFAGYVHEASGDFFSTSAYTNPFLEGFEAANKSSIIPVNSVPGKNLLEVWWFRKNPPSSLRDEKLGFKPTYWPSILGRYTIEWPGATHPGYREIILASNHGSGPLNSLEAGGSLYFQNTNSLPGFNPNEEHALLQGGRIWALRDDLNITNGVNFSSMPFVLLQFKDADSRPSISAFRVLRENSEYRFDYPVDAGLVLQPPMPLPLLDKPVPPPPLGKLPRSINAEAGLSLVDSSSLEVDPGGSGFISFNLLLREKVPPYRPFEKLCIQHPDSVTRWVFTTSVKTELLKVAGFVTEVEPSPMTPWTGAPASQSTRYRYAVTYTNDIAVGVVRNAIVANVAALKHWGVTVTAVEPGYVEVDFGISVPGADATNADVMIFAPSTAGTFENYSLSYERRPAGISNTAQAEFYSKITFQDRKGNTWIYRGPHDSRDSSKLVMNYYYRTLPGFWYPTDADGNLLATAVGVTAQPPVGTFTPYLRPANSTGTGFLNDGVYGMQDGLEDADGLPMGDGNPLGIHYRSRWPDGTPVLQMAETLTVPKRGLPAIRGQTSLEILYQQSVYADSTRPAVVLHDPTVAKKFQMFGTNPDGSPDGGLNKIPASIQTSVYRGKTFFPRLSPHLVERFYFDPNEGANGALVFNGEFKNEVLGESYLLLNVISQNDIDALKALCLGEDPQKTDWDNAIDNATGAARLKAEVETFYPNPAKPGTFTSSLDDVPQSVAVHASELATITHADSAVDSYALTAVGPGTGYVTLIAGQGSAFTPSEEPVAVKIIRVVDTLYRGEVKVILPSNPLGEKVTMQQIVDLAGKVQDFDFEWWIASPVDGFPPQVYGNTPANLLFSGSVIPWSHLRHPHATETAASIGKVGVLDGSSRLVSDISTTVVPISSISFASVNATAGSLHFVIPSDTPSRLEAGNALMVKDSSGSEFPVVVSQITDSGSPTVRKLSVVAAETGAGLPAPADIIGLYERAVPGKPQSIVFREFSVPSASSYSQIYLSLDLDDSLGARVYLDGALVVTTNLGEEDTTPSAPPVGFTPTPLRKVYSLPVSTFAGGTPVGSKIRHRVAVELFSGAIPGAQLRFNCQVDAFQSVDLVEAPGSQWLKLDASRFPDKVRTVLGENADVRALSDNYVISRYKAKESTSYPAASKQWSQWTDPALAEGWIKRVLAGINPFNQRTTDLFNNTVNTDANILTSAGRRWEGDVALNLDSINNYGLIEIYETVLRRGRDLSINAGISFDPANDALLLAAGYLSDLYMMVGNEARFDAANPTIGIGTKDKTYGDIATALFAFKGQLPTLLEEELALLRGRDDFFQPGVTVAPVYNRLIWNYTRGIDAGEVIYALNYNILDQNNDGRVDATDASRLYPQGHGDAYGHYLTALKGYYSLLIDKDFSWVPRIEAVNILGKPVSVDYQDERKFASAAASVARTGRQIFDLTLRKDYQSSADVGWQHLSATRSNPSKVPPTQRYWGVDHWAARTGSGAYINWALGNSILPPVDPNPDHEGIQKVDRTTVPELKELATTGAELQTAMDNAEGRLTPLGLAEGSLAFDVNPNQVAGPDPKPHFEQVYDRAIGALNNAVTSFDDAKDVTRLMRSEQDSLAELQASILRQEQAYTNALIELYGTPYPDDVGPGKVYRQGYAGPDLIHFNYVETESIEAPGVFTPNVPDYVAKIDIQQLNANWSFVTNLPRADLSTNGPVDGSSSDLVIVNLNDPLYNQLDPDTGKPKYYIPYAFGSHGFFGKPQTWKSKRQSPGKIQQAISEVIQAHDRMYYALAAQCESDKQDLDKAVQLFKAQLQTFNSIRDKQALITQLGTNVLSRQKDYEIASKWLDVLTTALDDGKEFALAVVPDDAVFGLAFGGDIATPVAGGLILSIMELVKAAAVIGDAIGFSSVAVKNFEDSVQAMLYENEIAELDRQQQLKAAIVDLGAKLKAVQGDFQVINEKLRILDDKKRHYASLVAQGERLQQEREIFRQRSAALVQGFRTRDAAFRIFRNEKLERYKSLFDLSARYAYLAANAYDYETGLLNTPRGREFVNRIVNSRALGVVKNGEPQFAGSNLGDPGLSSVLAEMKADWGVLKGRLGFNNPAGYGTTFSLRTEKHRIMPGAEGANAWRDVLNKSRKPNILEDADVKRFCMQIDPGNGLPVPGLVIEFETTVAEGYNFFGQIQQGGDHYFDPSSFATKIFAAGVAFEGYVGMDNPASNNGTIGTTGGVSPADPTAAFLDPRALGATPGIYLIPVGLDSMRSPALGDQGNIRTWSVEDVTIPLPFNIGGSEFSSRALYQSSESLTEPMFGIRKHAAFRPVSTPAAFSSAIYNGGNGLARSQFTNTRLIGRSVWNSKWKIVIPGTRLLHDADEGLRRFIDTVTDVKLHLVTYSYSGN